MVDVSENQDDPLYLVNPSFVVLDETLDGYKEGCLSIPTFYEEVYRPKKIELSYQDLDGKHQKLLMFAIKILIRKFDFLWSINLFIESRDR